MDSPGGEIGGDRFALRRPRGDGGCDFGGEGIPALPPVCVTAERPPWPVLSAVVAAAAVVCAAEDGSRAEVDLNTIHGHRLFVLALVRASDS